MVSADVAIIGGTGIGDRLAALGGEPFSVENKYGPISGLRLEYEGVRLALVQRHSAGHRTPPHLVNYRAIATGLASLGAKACLASAAVGSLRTDWPVGTLAICRDFLDLTGRRLTLFDDVVKHTDFSEPMPASRAIEAACSELRIQAKDQAVYLGADGPRYETPAEIRMMRMLGGDVVGMTASTEAILMREAGVAYGCLAVVTNLGTGLDPDVQPDHGAVTDVMQSQGDLVVSILLRASQILAT